MSLLKTSTWSLTIVIISTIIGFVSQKLYAIYTGTEGLIAIGNFNNFSSIIYILASGGIYGGIVKLIASEQNEENQQKLLAPIFTILFFYAIITTLLLLIFDSWTYSFLYKNLGVSRYVNYIFYLSLPLIVFSNGILYVLNGRKKIKKYSILSISIHLINFLLTYLLVKFALINGALLSLFLPSVIGFFIMIFVTRDDFSWPSLNIFSIFNSKIYKSLISFSLVSLLSIVLLSISQLIIRDFLLKSFTVVETSFWQVISNFSKIWIAVIVGVLSMYFYPKIASLHEKPSIKKEVNAMFKVGIPVLLIGFFIIFILKNDIIKLVYTKEFLHASKYIAYQLIGDLLKTIGLIFGYAFLAKNQLKFYAISEIVFTISYVVLGVLLTNELGLKGVFIAYIISYFLYIAIQVLFYRVLFKNNS